MKDFVINRDSWHYRLNKRFFNAYEHYMEPWEHQHADFCSYWRATFWRVLFITLFAAWSLIMVVALAASIYQAPIAWAIGFGMVAVGAAAAAGMTWGVISLNRRRSSAVKKGTPPGLVATKYLAVKSKICPRVVYDAE